MDSVQPDRINKAFEDHFGVLPRVTSFAPGRVNLIGGHTDYNDGFVLPGAIDKGVFAAFGLAQNQSAAVATDTEDGPFSFDLAQELTSANEHWHRFVIGAVQVLRSKGHDIKPFNLVFGGNLPQGGGVSSSAALENSLVVGLNALFNLGLSKIDMIFIAQQIEHDFVGVKCGIMDQYASMFGESGKVIHLDCRSLDARSISLPLNGYQLMLFNTKVKHQLSDAAYNDRRNACQTVAQMAGVKSLRDLSMSALEGMKQQIGQDKYEKAKYIVEEIQRTGEAVKAIDQGDLMTFGRLMFEAHEGLRSSYQVSCAEQDFFIDLAQTDSDVIGARMMGGGFGGCTINIVKAEAVQRVAKEFSERYFQQFGIQCDIQKVILSDGAQLVKTTPE